MYTQIHVYVGASECIGHATGAYVHTFYILVLYFMNVQKIRPPQVVCQLQTTDVQWKPLAPPKNKHLASPKHNPQQMNYKRALTGRDETPSLNSLSSTSVKTPRNHHHDDFFISTEVDDLWITHSRPHQQRTGVHSHTSSQTDPNTFPKHQMNQILTHEDSNPVRYTSQSTQPRMTPCSSRTVSPVFENQPRAVPSRTVAATGLSHSETQPMYTRSGFGDRSYTNREAQQRYTSSCSHRTEERGHSVGSQGHRASQLSRPPVQQERSYVKPHHHTSPQPDRTRLEGNGRTRTVQHSGRSYQPNLWAHTPSQPPPPASNDSWCTIL